MSVTNVSYVSRDTSVFAADLRNLTSNRVAASTTVVPELRVDVFSTTALTASTITATFFTASTVFVANSLSSFPRIRKYRYDPVARTETTFATDGHIHLSRIATLGTFSIADGISCVAIENCAAWTLTNAHASHSILLVAGPQTVDFAIPDTALKLANFVPVVAYGTGVSVVASATAVFNPSIVSFPNRGTDSAYLYVGRYLGSVSFTTPLDFYVMFV